MLRLRHEIIITTSTEVLSFIRFESVSINRSWDNMTQTAKITIPRNAKYKDKSIYQDANSLIKRGDKVEIKGGYYPNLTSLFTGYISKINNNVPLEILCEDEMFLVKQHIVPNVTLESPTLKELLTKILPSSVKFKCLKAKLGQFRINEASCGKVLELLRSQYGLYSYFRNGILSVGLAYYPSESNTETILFETQMVLNGTNLNYIKKDDVKVQVKGILINGTTQTEKIYGDKTGDIRTVFVIGSDVSELDRKCNAFLLQSNYTGYYGSFKTFLEPKIIPGDKIILDSYMYPERKGTYICKSVETIISFNEGGKQIVELAFKV